MCCLNRVHLTNTEDSFLSQYFFTLLYYSTAEPCWNKYNSRSCSVYSFILHQYLWDRFNLEDFSLAPVRDGVTWSTQCPETCGVQVKPTRFAVDIWVRRRRIAALTTIRSWNDLFICHSAQKISGFLCSSEDQPALTMFFLTNTWYSGSLVDNSS